MKTRAEIEREAEEVTRKASPVLRIPREPDLVEPTPIASIFSFPRTTYRSDLSSGSGEAGITWIDRSVTATLVGSRIEFGLVEREMRTNAQGKALYYGHDTHIWSAKSAYDILVAGYQRIDEDILRERMAPIAARLGEKEFPDAIRREDLAELDNLTAELSLSPSSRIRVRADAIAFLEGRLEAEKFLSRAVDRQDCFEPKQAIQLSNQHTQAIEV